VSPRFNWEFDGQNWPNRQASTFVSAAGLKWHVQCLGSGPPLLLLHGTGASTHSLRTLMRLLSGSFTLIAPDLPGHGFTSMPTPQGLSLPGMAAGIGALMQEMAIEPVLAAGHSAGAAILIRATLDRQISPAAIISINGALLPFGSAVGQFFSPIARLMVATPLVHRLMAWRARNPTVVENLLRGTGSKPSPEDVALYARLFRNPGHVAAALGMMANWDLNGLIRDLPRLVPPLVLVTGLDDRAIPPADTENVRKLLPSARILRLPDAGHLAHEEQPAEVAAMIVEIARAMSLTTTPDRQPE
jgi:magnesium chelatase accessory protein